MIAVNSGLGVLLQKFDDKGPFARDFRVDVPKV